MEHLAFDTVTERTKKTRFILQSHLGFSKAKGKNSFLLIQGIINFVWDLKTAMLAQNLASWM